MLLIKMCQYRHLSTHTFLGRKCPKELVLNGIYNTEMGYKNQGNKKDVSIHIVGSKGAIIES